MDPRERFLDLLSSHSVDEVLEIGTAQAVPGIASNHMFWFSGIDRRRYVMADIVAGSDVDVVADIHHLPQDWAAKFSVVIAVAVFEHLQRPWIAAREVMRVLRPGGLVYIATHQTFPLHGYPQDYYRFSKEGLRLIFEDVGLIVIDVAYEHRCKIIPPSVIVSPSGIDEWNDSFPSYLNVHLVGCKGVP
jgi:SAM-dependent methyltransferase